MKLLKKLRLNVDIIADKELKREYINLVNYLLGKYRITSNVHEFVFPEYENLENFVTVAEGINYEKLGYNFIHIYDEAYHQMKLIVRPIYQNSFNDNDFGESLCINYDIDTASLIVSRIFKEYDDLVSELYMYVRNKTNNSLVLGVKRRIYDGNFVKASENKEYDELYYEGRYLYEELVNSYFDKLFLVSKNTNGQDLSLTNEDTCFILHDGIVIYDYKNRSKKHPTIITRFDKNQTSDVLINMYFDYQKIGKNMDTLDSYIKRKK